MTNGRRSALLVTLTLAGLILLAVSVSAMLITADGISTEEAVTAAVGLGLLSVVSSEVLGSSLWSTLPPAVTRFLGFPPDREQ